ncbi:DUF4382 domain-containing protein [Massilia sp. SR12]
MKPTVSWFTLITSTLLLAACGGGGGSSGDTTPPPPTQTAGILGVSLTDAPACGFDAVNVTISKVRVHQSATANDNDSGWSDINVAPARKINLLNLTNGVLESLGQVALPSGSYTQVRLLLEPSANNNNSVVPTGGSETVLETPSAAQSGIKLNADFSVPAGGRYDLVLDFDACKSIVTKGNGKYALKPVIKVVPPALNGINGYVSTALAGSNVAVTAQQNGSIVAATVPSATGEFVLSRLPLGNYDVVIMADNRAAHVIGAVPVTSASTMVQLSTTLAPFGLGNPSLQGSISGTAALLPASSTEVAHLSARQAISGGPTVTLRYANADLSSGAYSIGKLPLQAPQYVAYSSTLPLTFTPAISTPTAGSYLVHATATGYSAKTSAAVNISSADATGVNFSLVP